MSELLAPESLHAQLKLANLGILAVAATELEDRYLKQVIEKSRQPHITEYEGHEDVGTVESPGRFRTGRDYRQWAINKQRLLFLLVNQNNVVDELNTPEVGGIAWFGEREHPCAPGRSVTFALRNYAADAERGWQQYVGRGLAVPFMQTVHEQAVSIYQGKRLWLDLVAGNQGSKRMCERVGYEEIAQFNHGGKERIVMANDTAFMEVWEPIAPEPQSDAG